MKRIALTCVVLWIALALGGEASALQTGSVLAGETQTESAVLGTDVSASPGTEATPIAETAVPLDLASDEDDSFHVDITGRKTWTLGYGFGHPLGLALAGVAPGQFRLDQTLSVDFTAEAIEVLSVVAHLDDQQSDVMQSLAVYLDTERLDGVLGDFSLGDLGGAAAYNKKLLGLRLDYYLGDATITAVASQFEGITASRTFTGETASDEIEYAAVRPDQPWIEAAYRYHIDGLYAYALDAPYVEGFTDARFDLDDSTAMRAVLDTYGLGYLRDVIGEHGALDLAESDFTTVDDGMTFLLRNELTDYTREILEEAIDAYNDDLDGEEDARTYPFVIGSGYELEFLERLEAYLNLAVGDGSVPASAAERERFYDLGTTDVVESSVAVELTLDGLTYRSIYVPEFSDYSFTVHPTEGVLECDFPADFFASEAPAIRVAFDYYAISSGSFMLGFSLIPESEQVYLNETLLVRDTDYYIDYEIGILILDVSIELETTDVLSIEYEVYSGGLGGGSDYASYFYGLALDLPLGDVGEMQASLLRSQDDPGSSESPDTAQTMPNQQTVVSVSGDLEWNDLAARIDVGYNDELFPFDDNLRDNEPNEITGIAGFGEYVVFGHLDGFNVYVDGGWRSYDTANGLSGAAVRALDVAGDRIYFATNSGLTVVTRDGVSPFDRVSNWRQYDEGVGPPDGSIRSVAAIDGRIWVGTDGGVASVAVDEIDDPGAWVKYEGAAFDALGVVLTMAGDSASIYLGTDSGVYRYAPAADRLERISGAATDAVHDLALVDETLYAASDRGLRAYANGTPSAWLLEETVVLGVLVADDTIYAGTESGLVVVGEDDAAHIGWPITALGVGPDDALWAGSRADETYVLTIWRHGESVTSFDNEIAKIDGRDPRHYVDVSADEHRSRGLSARASFEKIEEDLSIYGSVESISPEYHAVGRLSRTDWTGWRVGAEGTLADAATWSVDHEYQMSDLRSEQPRGRSETALTLDWQTVWGPNLAVALRSEAINDDWTLRGAETVYAGVQAALTDSLFSDRVDVQIRWNDAYDIERAGGTIDRDTSVSAGVDVDLLEDFAVTAGWRRPIGASGGSWSGSETWTWSAGYEVGLGFASLEIDYAGERFVSLLSGNVDWVNQLDVGLDVTRFDLAEWSMTPRFQLDVDQGDDVSADARLTVVSRSDVWSVTTTVDGAIDGLGDVIVRDEERVSLNASYRAWEGVFPSVRLSAERDASTYEGEVRVRYQYGLDGSLRWETSPGERDTLSIRLDIDRSAAGTTTTDLTIDNAYQTDVTPALGRIFAIESDDASSTALSLLVDTAVDATLGGSELEFDGSLSAALNLAIGSMWGGSLRGSYVTGTKSAGGIYHSVLLELTVAIDFAFQE